MILQSSSVAVIADVPITIASSTKELWQVVVYIHCGGPHFVDDLEAAGAAHLGVHAYGYHVLIRGVAFIVDGGGVLPEGLVVSEVVGRREFPDPVIPPSFWFCFG